MPVRRYLRQTSGGSDVSDQGNGYAQKTHSPPRRLSLSSTDEGLLYTVQLTDKPHKKPPRLLRWKNRLKRNKEPSRDKSISNNGLRESVTSNDQDVPPAAVVSDTLRVSPSYFADKHELNEQYRQQYTISKIKTHNNGFLQWIYNKTGVEFASDRDVDSHLYKPSKHLFRYISWTFYSKFSMVFLSFLVIFLCLCLIFAGLLMAAGDAAPDCIRVSGAPFGTLPETRFSDAFALSWTTFTTVGYGNTYTSTGGDFDDEKPQDCSLVVFLCTLEAFLGLLYAGMCAAIMFGKVNRVQSHAHLQFANAICLQYEDTDPNSYVDDDSESDSDDDFSEDDCNNDNLQNIIGKAITIGAIKEGSDDDEEDKNKWKLGQDPMRKQSMRSIKTVPERVQEAKTKFRERYNGCPILKFQVVNEHCNREGGEMIDAVMKVIGIKTKKRDGKTTHSQYVRVNLVDSEHPFLNKVWHSVHVLDDTSPLLTNRAKQIIRGNEGRWPNQWLHPNVIRKKLDFQKLIVTVSGISNISAITVHAYKRYKIGDVLVGFDFVPMVYECDETGKLEVDLSMIHDVKEERVGKGENLRANSMDQEMMGRSSMMLMQSMPSIRFLKSLERKGSTEDRSSGHRKEGRRHSC